jgi:hypothetical protein
MNEIDLIVAEFVMPDEVYWALVDTRTGEKVAPWADADTPEGVMDALRNGKQ